MYATVVNIVLASGCDMRWWELSLVARTVRCRKGFDTVYLAEVRRQRCPARGAAAEGCEGATSLAGPSLTFLDVWRRINPSVSRSGGSGPTFSMSLSLANPRIHKSHSVLRSTPGSRRRMLPLLGV